MARRNNDEQPIGEDSFLDTIANLIGILIILVLIVGARAHTSAKEVVDKQVEEKLNEAEAPKELAMRVISDIEEQSIKLAHYEQELSQRSLERMLTNDRVNMAKVKVEKQLEELSEETKGRFETESELSELQEKLADLLKQQGDIPPDEEEPPVVLQHLPTPMAKTVFGEEIHVLLTGKKLSVIPWTQLVEALKRDARAAAGRNTQKALITNSIGPIDGFMMKYALRNQAGLMSDGTTARMGRLVELDKFVLEPTENIVEETVEEALSSGGRLLSELSHYNSKNLTVTVWVYPDSFQEFRKLKEMLFPEGYLCAARPLPFGVPIGASPNGASSTAQ